MTAAMDTRALRHWLHATDGPHLIICCAEHHDPDAWTRAVVRPGSKHALVQLASCVADADPAVLLELVAGGASGITVALDGCARPAGAEAVVARAGAFLSALGHPQTTDGPIGDCQSTDGQSIDGAKALPTKRKHGAAWPTLAANAVPMSRRALLGGPDGLNLAAPSAHPTQRLLAVLRDLTDGDGPGTTLDGIPTGVPRLTAARCAGSGACVRTCPVDALALTLTVLAEANPDRDAMAQFQLTFDPGRCTDCGQCLQICPESAIERSGQYVWSSLLAREPVSLRVGLTRRCARCGGPHGRLGELCPVCAYRASNPFGSTMPPGWPPETPTTRP